MGILKKITRRIRLCLRWGKHCLRKILQKYWYSKCINKRLKNKIVSQEKIRVLFVCHRPAVWGSMKTVYEAFCGDSLFETMMVTIPQKDPHSPDGYVDEGADEYFQQYHPIKGFDYDTKQYLDIKKLNPDVVFYQQPYDVSREKVYHSNRVNKFAKIGYISYFSVFPSALDDSAVLNTCYPMDFFGNINYFFAQNQGEYQHVRELLNKNKIHTTNVYLTGYPKYDNLQEYRNSRSLAWNYPDDQNRFRILWTPRWTTNENSCHFFAYKDKWFDYCRKEQTVDFVFRPHPQAWIELQNTGEFTKEQREEYFNYIAQADNMAMDEEKEYMDTFYSSDCLVSDVSSMMLQYFLTGKPIIYCHNPKSTNCFKKNSPISAGMYWAESWEDVESYLQQLQAGMDPLKSVREEIIREEYQISNDITAGEKVKNLIKEELLEMAHA